MCADDRLQGLRDLGKEAGGEADADDCESCVLEVGRKVVIMMRGEKHLAKEIVEGNSRCQFLRACSLGLCTKPCFLILIL